MAGWLVVLAFLVSVSFSGLVGIALITYVRRTWQLIRAENDHSIQHRILDGIDQLHTRLDLLSERMGEVERSLPPGPSQQEIMNRDAPPDPPEST